MIARFEEACLRLFKDPVRPFTVIKQLGPPKSGRVHVAAVRDTLDDFLVLNWVVSTLVGLVLAILEIDGFLSAIATVFGQVFGIAIGFGIMCLLLWLVGKWDVWNPAVPIVAIVIYSISILWQVRVVFVGLTLLRWSIMGAIPSILQGLVTLALDALAIATVLSIPSAEGVTIPTTPVQPPQTPDQPQQNDGDNSFGW